MTKRGVTDRLLAVPGSAWVAVFIICPLILCALASLGLPFSDSMTRDGNSGFPDPRSYRILVSDPLYLSALASSLKLAIGASLLSLLIGFPLAYWISRKREPIRSLLLAAVTLPLWVSFLVRVYAWMILLGSRGPLNAALLRLGIVDEPLALLHTDLAACVGIAYSYLPFLVFPIYASLYRQDAGIQDAAADLGAPPSTVFVRVTVPLARYGVVAGLLLVLVPALGEFVIPELLGGPNTLTLGRVLWTEFFENRDWAISSAIAITLLAFAAIAALVSVKTGRRESMT